MKWNRKLLNLLPGFNKKPEKPESKTHPVPQPAAASRQPGPQPVNPPDPPAPENTKPTGAPNTRGFGFARDGVITRPQKMLDEVCAFLARYLQCSEDQRTVLALWVLHTWCFAAARSTPYLAIQSAQKLSGKTLCLRLLSLLCPNPALTSGYTASALVNRIHTHPTELPTFLLDESPATVGSRSRSKNPKLRAILVSGFQPGIGYSDRSVECTIFSPKAFASTGPLPEPLADCSIPIIVQRLQDSEKSNIERFDLDFAQEEAKSILSALRNWSNKNLSSLKSVRAYKRKDFPDRLTARGQDIVEPLLQLADAVGGDYPARARRALVAVFDDVEKQRQAIVNQLLRDIRNCFQHHNWPKALRTPVLVSDLRALPSRPWDVDGPITDRGLARMLWPLKIAPQVFRKPKSQDDPTSTARGYVQADFVTVWSDLDTDQNQARVAQQPGSPTRAGVARDGVEVPSAVSSPLNSPGSPATPVLNAGVKAATSPASSHSSAAATTNLQNQGAPSPGSPTRAGVARDGVAVRADVARDGIVNKDAGCYAVTDTRIDPRIEGILDDPRNFYRQYPDQHKAQIRNLILSPRYLWPQPADDQMSPDEVFTVPGGIQMPFTVVNRYPEKPPRSYNRFQSERWPVLLTDDEKVQVALARFYEIYNAAVAEREKKQNESAQDRQEVCSAVS